MTSSSASWSIRTISLWIGTYFGGLDCFDGKKFIHYRHDDKIPGSLADDRVMCLYEDSEKDLWIGTLASGFDRLDRKKIALSL
jgi:ligand-binding sensor domain-containing protein